MLDAIELRPGMQVNGISSNSIYKFAARCISTWPAQRNWKIVDVGGGRGDFARTLLDTFDAVTVLDCLQHPSPLRISYIVCDLNGHWPLPSHSFDALVSLEVIEHLENPDTLLEN